MITKYNKYIKEEITYKETFSNDVYHYIHSLLPTNHNLFITRNGANKVYLVVRYNNIINIIKDNSEYKLEDFFNRKTTIYLNIDDLYTAIKYLFDTYYNIMKLDITSDIEDIPVFNIEKYNDVILNHIKKYPNEIKYIKNISQYLTDDTLKSIHHLIDASKFDLI